MRFCTCLVSVVALTACGPTVLPSISRETHSAILASTADTTTSDVFILDLRYSNNKAGICSATLISPRVLLTAGHCVDPAREGASTVAVKATNKADTAVLTSADLIDAVEYQRHPQYSGEGAYDLALILLATPPVGVSPRSLVRTPPSTWPNQNLRLVGYGRTAVNTNDSGIRRSASVKVTTANVNALEFGTAGAAGICSGDSGGAAMWTGTDGTERLAAVHSYGKSTSCGNGGSIRVDTQLSFIDTFVTTKDLPLCTSDGRCKTGCTTPDPDCNCIADSRCDMSCASPDPDCRCIADNRCDMGCTTADPDCRCIADSRCDTGCSTPDVDCRCIADSRCDTGCSTPDPDCRCKAGDSKCDTGCATPDPDCPASSTPCDADGMCSTAVCSTPDPDCVEEGFSCEAAEQCQTRTCLDDGTLAYCSKSCTTDGDCRTGMLCRDGNCHLPELQNGNEMVMGGCSVTNASALLTLLAVLARRRPRRH